MKEYDASSCPLFKDMMIDEINNLLDRAVFETRIIDKGKFIVRQGDKIDHLCILVEGLVRTEMITKEGNILEIEFIEGVRPLAPAFLFAQRNVYPVDVITIQRSVFFIIPLSTWIKELMTNEQLLKNFLKVNSNMTVFLSNKVQMMSIKSLKAKLSLYIMENTTPQNNSFMLKRTQTQLAEYFGVQRPSLARTFGEMISEGIISLYKRELTVLDRVKLENII